MGEDPQTQTRVVEKLTSTIINCVRSIRGLETNTERHVVCARKLLYLTLFSDLSY